MTEMTEKVTIQKLQEIVAKTFAEGISPLLIPSIAELCNRNGLARPGVIRANTQEIVIAGLPHISAAKANNSTIAAICHKFQHYYRDGDYIGKSGIQEKYAAKEPLVNNSVRISFTYTILYHKNLLRIGLMRNYADEPVNIHLTEPTVILRSHVHPKHIRKFGNDVYLAIPMLESEIQYYESLFSAQCAQAIQCHLDQVFLEALCAEQQTGKPVTPDYYGLNSIVKEDNCDQPASEGN